MLKVILELTKARLAALVIVTTVVGYLVAARAGFEWLHFASAIGGTALCAACANAFNQVMEVERDAQMPRTAGRPIPSGRMSRKAAALFSSACGVAGVALLLWQVNWLTAALGLITILTYLLIYTPLKPRSHLNTIVGSIVGAIPPMMGWTAVTGQLDGGAWALGAILFVWQIPHFLALAWMYRSDYEQGGYQMLPAEDESGQQTARITLTWSLVMLPVSLSIAWLQLAGFVYVAACLLGGAWIIWLSFKFTQDKQIASARKLFLASITYLPVLLIIMVLDEPKYWF